MSISVLNRAYGNDRSGTNTQESVLTAAAARSRGIRRLFLLPLPGDRRGAEAQPLIVPGVALPGGPDPRSGVARGDGKPGLRVRRQ